MKTITAQLEAPVRINKYLSDQGLVSRRKADEYIKKDLVSINGKSVTLGTKVSDGDIVTISLPHVDYTYALYVKPRGEVTGRIPEIPNCEPVGRLDKDSEGLLFYTDDLIQSSLVKRNTMLLCGKRQHHASKRSGNKEYVLRKRHTHL